MKRAEQPANIQPIFIAGPTAVGKSALALALAQKIKGEIISVDSMQVYRGLDIGTAKPTPEERAQVPHHLIDVVEITEAFDAAKFCALARQAACEISQRGNVPIFCGGTGLYFKAYLEGLGEAPPADETLRAELEEIPLAELLKELQQKDALTFSRIDKHNPRRVVRAMEVIRITGKPFSEQRSNWQKPEASIQNPGLLLGIERSSEELQRRINERVDEMFRCGIVQETEQLLKQGLAENKSAMQAIGYRQIAEHLRGEHSIGETVELIKIKTRQFAKRQMTWFRRQMNLRWISGQSNQTEREIVDQITSFSGWKK